MTNPNDYTQKSGWAALAVIAVLLLIGFIPPVEVWGVSLRRAYILSELLPLASSAPEVELTEAPIEEVEIDWAEVEEAVAEAELPQPDAAKSVERMLFWAIDSLPPLPTAYSPRDSLARRATPEVLIEDFDTTDHSSMRELYRKLACGEPVRIAFLGDSFVEGDILTADLRERLQQEFGGGGVGFAPMASPLTGFRRTIKTKAQGWTSHNIMQWKNSSPEVQRSFTVAGWACLPTSGASTRWQGSDARRGLEHFEVAKLWFISEQDSRVEVVVNDSIHRTFTLTGDSALRQIEVHHADMQTLTFKVLEGAAGFVGHGVQFSDRRGVVVDNYSVRSNNGRAIFWSSPTLNVQLQNYNPYDLVVLQYGLNIMQQGVLSYTHYSRQVEQMVAYARQCFPGAAILVLGVSERWVKDENGYAPMDALPYMVKWQRTAAQNTGAAFWSTADAMQALGGMELFVANGWAGKDYTHINYAGGRQVAYALYEALYHGVYAEWQRQVALQLQRKAEPAVLDAERVDSLLFPQSVQPTRTLNL